MAEAPHTISITPLLNKLLDPTQGTVTADEIAAAVSLIFTNQLSTAQCVCLLTLLHPSGRGGESDVVAKCASQMRNAASQIDRRILRDVIRKRRRNKGNYGGGICDLVGTGGDGHSTFNASSFGIGVSTTASIVASSLLLVGKHGAKASSSKSGAADMLQAIQPKAPVIEAITAETVPRALEKGNFVFLFAPVFHSGMRHVAPIRRDLGVKTIFNILGPLANPADSLLEARVLGVLRKSMGRTYIEAAKASGARKTMVVCGAEDLDEISPAGKTLCWRLREKANPDFRGTFSQEDEEYTTSDDDAPPRTLVDIEEFQIEPQDFDLPSHSLDEVLPGRLPEENANTLMKLLRNELSHDDPVLHFVLLNAAALFVVSGICDADESSMGEGDSGTVIKERGPGGGRWREGVRRARWAIESGAALRSLEQYVEFTRSL